MWNHFALDGLISFLRSSFPPFVCVLRWNRHCWIFIQPLGSLFSVTVFTSSPFPQMLHGGSQQLHPGVMALSLLSQDLTLSFQWPRFGPLCSGMLSIPHPHPKEAAWGFQEMLWLPLLISTIYNPAQKCNITSPSAPYLQCKYLNVRVSDSWLPRPRPPSLPPPHSGPSEEPFSSTTI